MNKMKHTILRAGSRASLVLFLALTAAATACEDRLVSEPGGALPDETAIGHIGSTMRSSLSISGRGQIVLAEPVEGEEPRTVVADEIYYELSKPATTDTKVTLSVGTELTPEFLAEVDRQNERIKAYNKLMWSFPAAQEKPFGAALLSKKNFSIEAEGLAVPAGKTMSEVIKLFVSNFGLSRDTLYLLPVVFSDADGQVNSRSVLVQYLISAQKEHFDWMNRPGREFTLDTDFFTVFYVNTAEYQPLVAETYGFTKRDRKVPGRFYRSVGNLVNLKPAVIGYDAASDRAIFSVGADLRYVLEHRQKYISPLQNHGRKVCICIQGGGKGLGFCNLNDAQIADFTAQVKKVVLDYNLDGVNLWDEGAKYGKEGMLAVNTTSYPKLIKALREAMPDKLLTLVDKDEPTEYFYDVEACGGIEVGKYLDYAWHGYFSEKEYVQVIEPWESQQAFSKYARKPIAGLSPEIYGSVNYPLYGSVTPELTKFNDKRILDWKKSGRIRNRIVVFGFDLTSNQQGAYEGHVLRALTVYSLLADRGDFWGQNPWDGSWGVQVGEVWYNPTMTQNLFGYNAYWKDW